MSVVGELCDDPEHDSHDQGNVVSKEIVSGEVKENGITLDKYNQDKEELCNPGDNWTEVGLER